MELSHGHPQPSSSGRRSQQSHRSQQGHRSLPDTSSPLATLQQHDIPFGLQNRRLQLRNAGFRGSDIPGHKLSARLSRFFHANDVLQSEPPLLRNQEKTSPEQLQTATAAQSDHRPGSALGILQEISNSTRRRYSQKGQTVPILEDNPHRPLLDFSPETTPISWYHDAPSTPESPLGTDATRDDIGTMRLREVSGNERRSPPLLSSPIVKSIKGRKKRGLDLRKTSFGASEYIKHIENELEQVKEAMHSPNTGRPLQEMLKILKIENRQLKNIIADLEEAFEARLKDAVDHKTAAEVEMRKKIKALEDGLIEKDQTIRDLEECNAQSNYDRSNIDVLKATIERLEEEKRNLEDTSRVVEKRNEALTGLLAQSPTKQSPTRSHHGFELASSFKSDSRRTPRPKSMMIPRLHSSPPIQNSDRPRSIQVSPTHLGSDYFSPTTSLRLEQDHSYRILDKYDPEKQFDSQSFDSELGDSCSARSPPYAESTQSSVLSHPSPSTSAWGLPLPLSPSDDKGTVRPSKHRRTRRFESGSTQLKPLLLPAMAGEGSSFQNASGVSPLSSPSRREFSEQSEQSLDPTISFLSAPQEPPIDGTYTTSLWTTEDALKALGGSSEPHSESFEDIIARLNPTFEGIIPSPPPKDMLGYIPHSYSPLQATSEPNDEPTEDEDVTAFLNRLDSVHEGEQLFSSMAGEVSFAASNLDGACGDGENLYSPSLESSFCVDSSDSDSAEAGPDPALQPFNQAVTDSTQQLMPEPILLPTPLYRVSEATFTEFGRPCQLTADVFDDSPNPRKRRKSGNYITASPVSSEQSVHPRKECRISERSEHVSSSNASGPTVSVEEQTDHGKTKSGSRSPIRRLQQKSVAPNPLTSVTIRTIFGTLSRYRSYIQEIRRDPTALARRVIANAWCSNWKRFGKLSWWVLGVFLGSGARREHSVAAEGWDWGKYDGEDIAEQFCYQEEPLLQQPTPPSQAESYTRKVRFDEQESGYRTNGSTNRAKPALKGNPEKHTTSWGKSLYLWGKFSVAIMFAVGGAVISGPEEMLKDCDEHRQKKLSSKKRRSSGMRSRKEKASGTQDDTALEFEADYRSETKVAHGESAPGYLIEESVRIVERSPPDKDTRPTQYSMRRQRQPPSPPPAPSKVHMFGAPCHNEGCDRSDDHASRYPVNHRFGAYDIGDNIASRSRFKTRLNTLGNLEWMRTLSLSDFQDVEDEQPTVRARRGKRPRSLIS